MSEVNQEDAHRTVERVARESYGRLVAYLSVHSHDVASAEDALSNALVSALKHWSEDGVPQNPEAWLLTAARHSLIDTIRHERVALESEPRFLAENSTGTALSSQFPKACYLSCSIAKRDAPREEARTADIFHFPSRTRSYGRFR